MKPVILGDGLLGQELNNQTGWPVVSRREDGFDITNIDCFKILLDTFEDNHTGQIASTPKYDTIINCIAYTDSYSDNKSLHWDVNYKGVADLVDFCNKWKIKLVHISTEFVYANNSSPATEEDLPLPAYNWYAYTKLLADEYIKLRCKQYLVCRELHKPYPFTYKEVWEVQTSGDTVDKIASILVQLINKNIEGTINVGTGDKYLIELSQSGKQIQPPPEVPLDTRMNLQKLNKTI